MRFKRHADGRWGPQPQTWPDRRTDFWRPLSEHDEPWLLRGQPHGTQVVLLGDRATADTTQAPGSVTEARPHWVARYLNTRFLRLPDPVELLVREDHRLSSSSHDTGHLRRIHGQRNHLEHLEHRAIDAGAVDISDARVHWWVLDDDHRGRRRESATWTSTGHAAALFETELYDLLPQTRGDYGRIQDFGVRFGYERVRALPRTPDRRATP